jgi:hypothetical protein
MTRETPHKDDPDARPPRDVNTRELQEDPTVDPHGEPVQQHLEKPRRRRRVSDSSTGQSRPRSE